MIECIKAEIYKLRHCQWTYLFLIILSILMVLYVSAMDGLKLMVAGEWNVAKNSIGFFVKVYGNPENVKFYEVLRTSLSFTFFIALDVLIFAIMFFSMEFDLRTLNNSIVKGLSRSKLFFSKILVICSFSTICYTICVGVIFLGTLVGKKVDIGLGEWAYLGIVLILSNIILISFVLTSIGIYVLVSNALISVVILTLISFWVGSYHIINFEQIANVSFFEVMFLKGTHIYYWQNICAGRINQEIVGDLLLYSIGIGLVCIVISNIILRKKEIK